MARRDVQTWAALALFAFVSFAYFGIRLLVGGRSYVGVGGDPQIFIWSFAWWPHAIFHGQNPFVTHAIWAPDGTNLSWATTMPGLALALTPLTLLFGPLASFDVATLAMPALSAWTAFLLCRHVTRRFWPSLFGGYLFGFSNYEIGGVEGHLHLTSVFLLPLAALVVVRYLEGAYSLSGFVVRFGVIVAVELSFSTEIAFTGTLALVAALLLAFVLLPNVRARMARLVGALVGSYAFAAVIASPLLYFALSDFHPSAVNVASPTEYSTDVVNSIVPTYLLVLGRWTQSISDHFTGNASEQIAYIGLPGLVVLAWFAVTRFRTASGRFLLAAIAVAYFFSLGAWLHVDGRQIVTLPWEHIGYLPLFDNILPGRLFVYVTLAAAVASAIWAASPRVPAVARSGLGILAVLALVPYVTSSVFRTKIHEPSFITARMYEHCLRADDNVLVFPFGKGDDAMLWQADADFAFRMAEGRISPKPPDSFTHPAGVAQIAINGNVPDNDVAPLRQYIALKQVTVVLVDLRNPAPWPALLRQIKAPSPREVGGLLVYRIGGTASRCAA